MIYFAVLTQYMGERQMKTNTVANVACTIPSCSKNQYICHTAMVVGT